MIRRLILAAILLVGWSFSGCSKASEPVPLASPSMEREVVSVNVTYQGSYAKLIDDAKFDANQLSAPMLKQSPARDCPDETVEATLIKLGKKVSYDEAVTELKAHGLRPASFALLLALAKQQPQKQLLKDIVCLTKAVRPQDACLVPYLGHRDNYDKQQRWLFTKSCDASFTENAWFAAVPLDHKRDCNWD